MHYEICWVGEDGLYGCGHEHPSVADAAWHMVPGSGSFLRAFESGIYRSLNDRELIDFLEALGNMAWSSSAWGKEKGTGVR